MTSEIAIRPASAGDAYALSELLVHLGYPTDQATVAARLGQLDMTGLDQVMVADEQGQIIGLAILHITPTLLHQEGPTARITTLVVDERHVRRGIGRLLVAAIETLARSVGCSDIEVSSNKRRAEANAFYEEIGYTPSSELLRKSLLGTQ